jgi:hypothetical protein
VVLFLCFLVRYEESITKKIRTARGEQAFLLELLMLLAHFAVKIDLRITATAGSLNPWRE